MTPVAELIEQGIRAYTRGHVAEAERCWSEALAAEPTNARARSYLDVLLGRKDAAREDEPEPPPQPARTRVKVEPRPGPAQAPELDVRGAPIPLPSPSTASSPPVVRSAPAASAPVALPPPAKPQTGVGPKTTLSWIAAIAANSPSSLPPPAMEADFAAVPIPPEAPPARPRAAIPSDEITPSAPEALGVSVPASDRPQRSTLSDYAPSPWDEGPALAPAVVLGEGDGLDLETVADQSDLRPLVPEQAPIHEVYSTLAPRSAVEIWMEGARELFALGDFSGSLEMLEKILKIDPAHEEARRYLTENESTLIAMYESKLGSRDSAPRLAIKPEEVMWLNLDHRAGFLLAQIDGLVTYDDLFALSGLPRLDTARILATLLQEGVIQSS